MNYKVLLLLTLSLVFSNREGFSQHEADKAAIQKVIAQLFKGMQVGDSAMVHAVFTRSAMGGSVFRDKENNPVLSKEDSFADFFKAIGTPHKETWHEETWDLSISIDDDLAQAWCQYAFYLDNKFSHCGIDAFYLHKEKTGWKIFYLVDTRRKQPCSIPQTIVDKHK